MKTEITKNGGEQGLFELVEKEVTPLDPAYKTLYPVETITISLPLAL